MISVLRKLVLITVYLILFIALTAFTQIGGVILILCLPLFRILNNQVSSSGKLRLAKSALFMLVYFLFTLIIVPKTAPLFGRQPLPIFSSENVKPLNILTCILNRHYVDQVLYKSIVDASIKLNEKYPGSVISYLDANFPFYDGFPLLPHLSHDDGKKLDLAFFYKDKSSGKYLANTSPSWVGYGVYEEPVKGELNQPEICKSKGYWQYSLLENAVPQGNKNLMELDEERTRELVSILVKDEKVAKLFIEPHLKKRFKLNYSKIRFHGCHAVRHDDHLHVGL